MIGPPYTQEFVNLFLPLINNEYISNFLKADVPIGVALYVQISDLFGFTALC
jgi:hypothetical protein